MSELTVLCVDPDESGRAAVREAFAGEDVTVTEAGSVDAARNALGPAVDCVVTEYTLPDGTGLDVAGAVREMRPDLPVVLFTNESPNRIRTDDREGVVVEYLPRDLPGAGESLARLVGNVVTERSQVGYPLPTAEDERLAALEQYDQLGLETAEAFERLTALAGSYFDVDVAFVGLVDAHEERFLACSGANWETLSREDSMCTHTILKDDAMVVEDTHADGRFADNDRLDELNIRAYAGVPLETPRGATIGAFCLTDDEPRSFSESDIADLRRFADEAVDQPELRHRLSENDRLSDGETTDDGGGAQ
jgi:CheY-like chemotaxis protein